MQFTQPGQPLQQNGWDDADVEALLEHTQSIQESQSQIAAYQPIFLTLTTSLLVLISALFAWHAIGPFLPTARQLIAKD